LQKPGALHGPTGSQSDRSGAPLRRRMAQKLFVKG
jgi:hypothetical protein